MRIALSFLLLVFGISQTLSRYLSWYRNNYNSDNWWSDYEYDLFGLSKQYDDGLNNLFKGESEEESGEILKPVTYANDVGKDENDNDDDVVNNLFLNVLDSLFLTSEESTAKNENILTNKGNMDENKLKENDDDDEDSNRGKSGETTFKFEIHLSNFFQTEEPKSSEENEWDVKEKANKNSVETFITATTENKSDESIDEVKPRKNTNVEIFDLENFSKDNNNYNADYEITDKDIEELIYFFMTLDILDDLINVANKNPDDALDDNSKAKEVDQYLTLFVDMLNKVEQDRLNAKRIKDNKADEYENKDDDDHTTTPKNDSDESNEDNLDDNDDKNNNKNTSASDSDENDLNFISFVFQGLDDAKQANNLNNNKYDLVESSQELKPTISPLPAASISTSTSSSGDQDIIHQYIEIRKNLDSQQHSLEKSELNLDRDFYAVISDNYADEKINKFENDLNDVHENLDRIKRNINGMQNLHSKLYFHKLITDAVKDAQSKSMI